MWWLLCWQAYIKTREEILDTQSMRKHWHPLTLTPKCIMWFGEVSERISAIKLMPCNPFITESGVESYQMRRTKQTSQNENQLATELIKSRLNRLYLPRNRWPVIDGKYSKPVLFILQTRIFNGKWAIKKWCFDKLLVVIANYDKLLVRWSFFLLPE